MVELNEVAKNSASEPQAIERQSEELSTAVFESNPENNIITPKTVSAATNPEALTEGLAMLLFVYRNYRKSHK